MIGVLIVASVSNLWQEISDARMETIEMGSLLEVSGVLVFERLKVT